VAALCVATAALPIPASAQGRVSLAGRALSAQDGPFPALGATLFWALWGEAHDPDRLDANLAWLAARRVDYVRILGMVGSESWSDRRIDPAAAEYWPTVDRLLERLGRHGLRAQATIFADAQVMMPEPSARAAFVDRWAARVNREPARFVLVEIANEHFQNGIESVAELRALGARLAKQTEVLVALSAPAPGAACAVYAGSAADVATMHYGRTADDLGPWGPVREVWEYPSAYDEACRGRLPPAVNNEPIGPGSSVAQENDPLKLVMAYATTFISGNAAYVVHAGAGIRGGGEGDRVLGRRANLFDVPGLDDALRGIQAVRAHLPPSLPNWTRRSPGETAFPLEGTEQAIDRGDLLGAFAAVRERQFVVALLGLTRAIEIAPRGDSVLEVIEPAGTASPRRTALRAGQRLTLTPRPRDRWGDALLVIGE
jgi:hypothetical protein